MIRAKGGKPGCRCRCDYRRLAVALVKAIAVAVRSSGNMGGSRSRLDRLFVVFVRKQVYHLNFNLNSVRGLSG